MLLVFTAKHKLVVVTHADGSRVSKAIIRVCVWFCLFVILSVRMTKPKRLKLKSPNFEQG